MYACNAHVQMYKWMPTLYNVAKFRGWHLLRWVGRSMQWHFEGSVILRKYSICVCTCVYIGAGMCIRQVAKSSSIVKHPSGLFTSLALCLQVCQCSLQGKFRSWWRVKLHLSFKSPFSRQKQYLMHTESLCIYLIYTMENTACVCILCKCFDGVCVQ